MGTKQQGRIFCLQKTKKLIINSYASVHANEGTFTRPSKPKDTLRLQSGGHGQDNIRIMEKCKVSYSIKYEYENGVRVGDIPNHKDKNKRVNHSWFPQNWTESTIVQAGNYVSTLKRNQNLSDGATGYGTYKGVRVGIIYTNGKIGTVFPDSNQSSISKLIKEKKK